MNHIRSRLVVSERLISILSFVGMLSWAALSAQTSSVEASNHFGSNSTETGGGGGGGGGGGNPPPATFQAAFTLSTSGKQLVANCAACHNLEIKVGDRTLKDGEVGTFRKGREYPVSVIDKPEVNRPNATVPPDHDTAKFTVWPLAVDGQSITKTDDDKLFFVSKNASVQYLIDNKDLLFAQNKGWSDTLLSKSARLLPVEVKEVWSNQIADVEVNGFPDMTGPNEYDYIFMGATSASSFNVKIKLAADIPAAARSQILFRWASEGVFGEFLPETGTSTFSNGTTVRLNSNFNINLGFERFLVVGFDENNNGQIDFSEPEKLIEMPHVRSGVSSIIPCKFFPIRQAHYEDSKDTLLEWATLSKYALPDSARHLTAFCNGEVPTYAGSEPTTIKRNEPGLTHPVGVAFTPTNNPGVSFKATISKDHDLSVKLIESNALRSWLAREFNSVSEAIRADIIEARRNGDPNQILRYSISAEEKSLAFGIIDPDLLFCLNKVSFENPTIDFDVNMHGFVRNVKVSGLANDLYDFDYEGEELLGYPAKKAAEVQAGFPSLGNGGKVFKTQIDLGGGNPYANPDQTPYTFFPY